MLFLKIFFNIRTSQSTWTFLFHFEPSLNWFYDWLSLGSFLIQIFFFLQRKVEEVQAQNSSLESENQKLEKNIENFKNAARSVETLEKELYALEPIKDKLDRDNKSLNKQGKH